jgi:hypothetical protein
MLDVGEVQEKIRKDKDELGLSEWIESDGEEFSLDLPPTDLQRLSLASGEYMKRRDRKSRINLTKLSNFLQGPKWKLLVFAFTAVALLIKISAGFLGGAFIIIAIVAMAQDLIEPLFDQKKNSMIT